MRCRLIKKMSDEIKKRRLCLVDLCKNEGNHLFPKDETRKAQWIEAIVHFKPGLTIRKYSQICSAHFKPNDFTRTPLSILQPNVAAKILKKTAVPSIFPWKTDAHVPPATSHDRGSTSHSEATPKPTEDQDSLALSLASIHKTYARIVPETELEQRIVKVYETLDHTGKHAVEVRDIPDVIRSLGCCPTNEEIEEVIEKTKHLDLATPGAVAHCPGLYFVPYMVKAMTKHKFYPANAEELLEAFRYFDPEGHGYITREKFAQIMMDEGETFAPEEFDLILETALDPVTGYIAYEYYINQLMIVPLDIYNIADALEAERKRIEEEEKGKKRRLI